MVNKPVNVTKVTLPIGCNLHSTEYYSFIYKACGTIE